MRTFKKTVTVLLPILAMGLLAGCNSSDDATPFGPGGVPTPTPSVSPSPSPTPPGPSAAFSGDTSAFVVYLRGLDQYGDPLVVNGGNVVFQDTAEVTNPVSVNP